MKEKIQPNRNVYFSLIAKYERNAQDRLKPTQLKLFWCIVQIGPLPETTTIRPKNMKPYFLLGLLLGFFAFYIGYELQQNHLDNQMNLFMYVIGFFLVAICSYQFVINQRDFEPILLLSQKGIQLRKRPFYEWSEVQTFQLTEYGRFREDTLIVKPNTEEEIILSLSGMNFGPNHVVHLIERYKRGV